MNKLTGLIITIVFVIGSISLQAQPFRVNGEFIIVVPNGINLEAIKDIKSSKETSDLIFMGRLLSHKNVDILIKAVEQLKKEDPKYKNIRFRETSTYILVTQEIGF